MRNRAALSRDIQPNGLLLNHVKRVIGHRHGTYSDAWAEDVALSAIEISERLEGDVKDLEIIRVLVELCLWELAEKGQPCG